MRISVQLGLSTTATQLHQLSRGACAYQAYVSEKSLESIVVHPRQSSRKLVRLCWSCCFKLSKPKSSKGIFPPVLSSCVPPPQLCQAVLRWHPALPPLGPREGEKESEGRGLALNLACFPLHSAPCLCCPLRFPRNLESYPFDIHRIWRNLNLFTVQCPVQ